MRFALAITAILLTAPAVSQQTTGSIELEDPLVGRSTITPNWAAINAQALGSKANPVRAYKPSGQRAYLLRLICPGGAAPVLGRFGGIGSGDQTPYGTISDGFELDCAGKKHVIYLDMYHVNHVEGRAVPGFTIRDP